MNEQPLEPDVELTLSTEPDCPPDCPPPALEAAGEAKRPHPPRPSEIARRESAVLERVIAEARPSIRQRLAQKGVEKDDLDDLCNESLARYSQALQRRQARGEDELERPIRYALAVADTVFNDYLRHLRPNWYRLETPRAVSARQCQTARNVRKVEERGRVDRRLCPLEEPDVPA